jgi:hypothetical protein
MSPSICSSVCLLWKHVEFQVEIKSGCPRGVFCLSSIPSENLFLCTRRKFGFNKKTRTKLLIVYVYFQPNSCNTRRAWMGSRNFSKTAEKSSSSPCAVGVYEFSYWTQIFFSHIGIGIQRGWTTEHIGTLIFIPMWKFFVFWYSRQSEGWTDGRTDGRTDGQRN